MAHVCKCHGVSGSCALQTCWRRLSELSRVGAHLKERYRRAARLHLPRAANSASAGHGPAGAGGPPGSGGGGGNGARAGPPAPHHPPHASTATAAAAAADALRLLEPDGLAFLEDSPDYCRRNESLGAPGTLGRECRRGGGGGGGDEEEDDSCERLCTACGLRVLERRVRVTGPCNCSFTWCCRVSCQQCASVHSRFRCGRPEAAGKAPGKKRQRARQQQQQQQQQQEQQRSRNRRPNAASQAVANKT